MKLKSSAMKKKTQPVLLEILLADDDRDDRYFFEKALAALPGPAHLSTVVDGEKLLAFLSENAKKLPDVLFLDLNMPRKSGAECLAEIKRHKKLEKLPVVIYSTSLHENVADMLYKTGAHYFVHKADFPELKKSLARVLTLLTASEFARPSREEFIINLVDA